MNGIEYIKELKKAYEREGLTKSWEHMIKVAEGVNSEERDCLLKKYPEIPVSLLEILDSIDGTYWRKYGDDEVRERFFGSDVDDGEYPYYLFSSRDILNGEESYLCVEEIIAYNRDNPELAGDFDERIRVEDKGRRWIHFADCINNGGTSTLYIDLTPSDKGKKGQIVRFLHDPDSLKVIADSFEEYLDMLVTSGMRFIQAK